MLSAAVDAAFKEGHAEGLRSGINEAERVKAEALASLSESRATWEAEKALALAAAEDAHKAALKHAENSRAYDRLQYQEE